MRGVVRPTAECIHSSTLSVSEKCFSSPFELVRRRRRRRRSKNDDEERVQVGG